MLFKRRAIGYPRGRDIRGTGMRKPLIAALFTSLVLGGCSSFGSSGIGSSKLNPFNWFGGSEETAAVSPLEKPADSRLLVTSVTSLTLERMPGGVIVRATGLPPTQGYWDAQLVARPVTDGSIVYDFRVFPPVGAAAVSTPQSREVTVASFLSDIRLATISRITVQGENNARSTRRR